MSTDLNPIEENNTSPALELTSFFGGADRGRCVQIHQKHRTLEGFTAHAIPGQTVALNQAQAIELISTLIPWLEENPTAATVLTDKLEGLLPEPERELSLQEKYPELILEESVDPISG